MRIDAYERSENLPAGQRCGRVVGLWERSALSDFEEDVIADALDIIFDQAFAFLAESHRQLYPFWGVFFFFFVFLCFFGGKMAGKRKDLWG